MKISKFALYFFILSISLSLQAKKYFASSENVVLISLDGLRPDALEKAKTPNINKFKLESAFSLTAQAVAPTWTLPNHTTMVTGVQPLWHGVLWNSYIPSFGTVTVPTIFELLKSKNMSTALIAGKEKFKHLLKPNTIDDFVLNKGKQKVLMDEALDLYKNKLPNFLFLHMRHPDSVGHSIGWMSPEQIKAIEECDVQIGRFLELLEKLKMTDKTTIILTSDHGGSGKQHTFPNLVNSTIPWMAKGPAVKRNFALLQNNISTVSNAPTVAYLLGIKVPTSYKWQAESVLLD